MVLTWKDHAALININRIKPVEQEEGAKRAEADAGMVTVILQLDVHCEGCTNKAENAMKNYQGVEDVKIDCGANKVTVTVIGKVDPMKLKESLEEKMKKKVYLISPKSKKDAGAGGGDIKSEKKPAKEKKAEKKLPKEQEEGAKRAEADAGAKTDDGTVTVILQLDLHCEGCTNKAELAMKNYQGVEDVKIDCGANKVTVTVTGKVNPVKLKESLEEKMKKKVDVISPKSKYTGAGGGNIKSAKKPMKEKTAEQKLPKEQEEGAKRAEADAGMVTVILQLDLHCEGCTNKAERAMKNYQGVEDVKIDCGANKVTLTVTGKVDPVKLKESLKEKMKKEVDLISPESKKDAGAGGGDIKSKRNQWRRRNYSSML